MKNNSLSMFEQCLSIHFCGLKWVAGRYTKPWFFKQSTPSKSSLLDVLNFAVLDGKNTYTMPQTCHKKYNDDLEVHVPAPNYPCGPCVVPIFHFRCVISLCLYLSLSLSFSLSLSLSLSLPAMFLVRIPIRNPNPNSFEHPVNPKALIPNNYSNPLEPKLGHKISPCFRVSVLNEPNELEQPSMHFSQDWFINNPMTLMSICIKSKNIQSFNKKT